MFPLPFKHRLLLTPFQTGALSVPDGTSILPTVQRLLNLPFALKIATKDWHPSKHISFASNHSPPNNIAFTSTAVIRHPDDQSRIYSTTLWPVHCVQNTPGAELVESLSEEAFNYVLNKGMDERIEMYSAFTDPFHERDEGGRYVGGKSVCTSDLEEVLRAKGVTHLYVVGLATEYCVGSTAVDGVRFGFEVVVVREGTKAVGGAEVAEEWFERRFGEEGVNVAGIDEEEVKWVEGLRKS